MTTDINVTRHYDLLIDENNDPVHDAEPLKAYMDGWDGSGFLQLLDLCGTESVLEIGVGTGRLAQKTAPLCKSFCGIDLSPKTIRRAAQNLERCESLQLICSDFMTHRFERKFDVVYSSLTFMHIEHKQSCFEKIFSLLNRNGRFVLSIDKNQAQTLVYGSHTLRIFPDNPEDIKHFAARAGLALTQTAETEFAHLFLFNKP